jgi:DNA primase
MPFNDAYGSPVAIVGRTLLSDDERKSQKISKYKNTVFQKGNFIFGLFENKNYILNDNSVFIVEGQFDVIKANEKGLNNIVALGNSNMTNYQFSVISRYTNNMFLLLDNDEAGEKGRKRIIDKFGNFANIQNFYLPNDYKDIDDYLTHNSYESISYLIKN